MKEFIEKLIERLEEKIFSAELYNDEFNGQTVDNLICFGDVAEIVYELAEEYINTSNDISTEQMDLSKQIANDLSAVLKEAKSMGCEKVKYFHNIPLENVETVINALMAYNQDSTKNNQGWIPCSERLPEDKDADYYESVIVTLDNGRVVDGCYRNKDEEWWVDAVDGEHYSINATGHVIAWQPLPEPYKPGQQKTRTRIERLQSMSAEELADIIINSEISTYIDFCKSNKECDEMLDRGVIEDDKCKKCLIKWLNSTEPQKEIPTNHYTERFNRVV